MSDIKIFTSFHKKCELLKNKYIYPIQVGTSLNGVVYENSLHDNTGENISKKKCPILRTDRTILGVEKREC